LRIGAPAHETDCSRPEKLRAEDVGRVALLDRRTDAVGADVLLGVAETRGQLDVVEVLVERVLPRPALQYVRTRIGEHHAHRSVREYAFQPLEHRRRGVQQPAVVVDVVVLRLETVHGDAEQQGPAPRGQDRVPYLDRLLAFHEPVTVDSPAPRRV
jgi:hypothetical protein